MSYEIVEVECHMALATALIGLGGVFQKAVPDEATAADNPCHLLSLLLCRIKPVPVRLLHDYILPQDMGFVSLCYTKAVSSLRIQPLCEHKGLSTDFISFCRSEKRE